MKKAWPLVPLEEVLRHRKEFIQIDDTQPYKRCRVQLHAQGIVLRDQVPGIEIKTKKQQVCRAGEFLVAEIDAKHGGYGIVPDDLQGAIVSSHYFLFEIDTDKLDRGYLGYFQRTPAFAEQVAAQGSTNYAAIRPSHVLSYKIPLPSLKEQRQIVARIERLVARVAAVDELSLQITLGVEQILTTSFRRLTQSARRMLLGDAAPLMRRPADVTPDGEYPQVSVRSFGRGTFHNPPLVGSEITWQKPYLVTAGDVLVSNIKAWEGAIAVASAEDDGRFGSHRYLTFVPVPGVVTARWLCSYLLSPEGLHFVGEASPGSADRNRTTSAKGMLGIPVPVPAYEKQLWFGQLFEKVKAAQEHQADARTLRAALVPILLQRAFKGEL